MTYVRANGTEEKIRCAWADCWQPGHDEIHHDVQESGRQLRYIFCTGRHRLYYLQSHVAYGQLPAGSGRDPGLFRP